MMQLDGKTAIVAQGARGVNAGIARALAAAGTRVLIADPDEAAAALLAVAIKGEARGLDAADPASIVALCEAAGDLFGIPDILVMPPQPAVPALPAEDMREETFDRIVTQGLKPAYLMVRAFVPAMRSRGTGGCILVPLGHGGSRPRAATPWAAAAQGWAEAAVRALAAELAPDRIRVNGLVAALDDSPALPRFMSSGLAEGRAAMLPLGRFATADEAGQAAVFLCSDAAATITGTLLTMDGGRGLS
jgi:3-oxoacyl-[acyl-carrier protein] reductase